MIWLIGELTLAGVAIIVVLAALHGGRRWSPTP